MRSPCFVTLLLFFTGCLTPQILLAQPPAEKIFRGVVLDSLDKTPLENCTVAAQGKNKFLKKIITTEKGSFSFKSNADTVIVLLQHIGYTEKRFVLYSKNKLADTLLLPPASTMMEGVVVKTKLPPVVVKGDTTEYNVDSSMFEPFDVVADLVKRLPGLEVDADGKMSFHGKPIDRILVDGEDLFGGDPNFSINKLPAGLVAKIQVMDTRTLEQIFNNIPSDGESKTLNVKLKAGNKLFGGASGGGGTKNNLDANGSISQFNEGKRISLMGAYNSSNKTGLFKTDGGPTSSSVNGGINYGNKWNNLRFNSSYNYNENGSSNESYRERTQQITTDTSFFTKSTSRFNNVYAGHHATVEASWWIDSSSTVDANLALGTTRSKSENSAASFTNENGLLRNQSLNNSSTTGEGNNVAASLAWRKRLNRNGRSFSLTATTNTNNQESDVLSQSTNTYFKNGLAVSGDTLDRQTKNKNSSRSYSATFTYSEPLGKNFFVMLNGNANWNRSTNDRMIYDLDSVTHKASFDSLYSASVSSSDAMQNLGTSLSYRGKKLNLSTGLSTTRQQTERRLQSGLLRQNLLRYSPTLNALYSLTKEKSLRAAFSATTIQPTIEQLQPVPDNSNPLYIRLGNPALRTAFSQNYTVGYNYNSSEGTLMASATYSPVSNQIVNAMTYDAYRRVTSQFINVSGVYNGRANLSYSKYFRTEKAFTTWNATSGLQFGQQVYFESNNRYASRNYNVNGTLSFATQQQGIRQSGITLSFSPSFGRTWTPADTRVLNTTRLNLSPEVSGSYNIGKVVYATLLYKLWYNKIDYHSALRRNAEYSLHQLNNSLRFRVLSKWFVQTAFTYQYNTDVPDGANKGQLNNTLTLNGVVWKGRGQINFTASDLFAAKAALHRTVSDNYIEDVQVANLRNYFTLHLQYGFSRLERRAKSNSLNIE